MNVPPKTAREFMSFTLVGAVNVALNAIVFVVLIGLGFHYLIASGIGWFLGVLNAYVMNRIITFKSSDPIGREISRHFLVYISQLIVSWTGLFLLIDISGLNEFVAYAINVIIVTLISFLGLKYFAFKSS